MPSDPLPVLSLERAKSFADRAQVAKYAYVDGRALEAALRSRVRGEVRFYASSRALYATDGSSYRQLPIGAGGPRDHRDLPGTRRAGAFPRRRNLARRAVLQRGGGARLLQVRGGDLGDRSGAQAGASAARRDP